MEKFMMNLKLNQITSSSRGNGAGVICDTYRKKKLLSLDDFYFAKMKIFGRRSNQFSKWNLNPLFHKDVNLKWFSTKKFQPMKNLIVRRVHINKLPTPDVGLRFFLFQYAQQVLFFQSSQKMINNVTLFWNSNLCPISHTQRMYDLVTIS